MITEPQKNWSFCKNVISKVTDYRMARRALKMYALLRICAMACRNERNIWTNVKWARGTTYSPRTYLHKFKNTIRRPNDLTLVRTVTTVTYITSRYKEPGTYLPRCKATKCESSQHMNHPSHSATISRTGNSFDCFSESDEWSSIGELGLPCAHMYLQYLGPTALGNRYSKPKQRKTH